MTLATAQTSPAAHAVMLGRLALVPDVSGALWLPDEGTLVVADLHLEKGSAYASRGVFLPPYDFGGDAGCLDGGRAAAQPAPGGRFGRQLP